MRTSRTALLTASIAALLAASAAPPAGAARVAPGARPAVQSVPAPVPSPVHQHRRHIRRAKAVMPVRRAASPTLTTDPITYHGGRLMTAPAHVHLVWYGDWSAGSAPGLIADLVAGFGGSAYADTNATYRDARGTAVTTDVRLGAQVRDHYSHGRTLGDGTVKAVVRHAIASGGLPLSSDDVYVVLTSADVRESSGFGTRYCGWHTHARISGTDVSYVFVGDPSVVAPRGCSAPVPATPNGLGADAMASTLVHELDETLTDPDLDGWFDSSYRENGDKCAWTYGTVHRGATGAVSNLRLGGHDLLVQENWLASTPQRCALTP